MIILAKPFLSIKSLNPKRKKEITNFKDFKFYTRGRDSLLACTKFLNLKKNSSIIVPAYICNSIIDPLKKVGLNVIFLDINENLQFDIRKVEKMIKFKNASALLVVHYFGFPSNIEKIVKICNDYKVKLIEDCCHSFLTRINGKFIGTFGDASIYSMRKTLPIPDGGALKLNFISSNKTKILLRKHSIFIYLKFTIFKIIEFLISKIGWPNIYSKQFKKFEFIKKNLNKSINEAFIDDVEIYPSIFLNNLLSNKKYLEDTVKKITSNFLELSNGLINIGLQPQIHFSSSEVVPQWFPLNDSSGKILETLRKKGIGACRWPWYEIPDEVESNKEVYPVSNKLNKNLTLIPIHQSVSSSEIKYIISKLKDLTVISSLTKKIN